MQGYGKVFKMGVSDLYDSMFMSYEAILPSFLVLATAYYTSYIELIAGAMLVAGFKRDWALYALASVLVIVTIGHGLTSPIWDLSHVMYRLILLIVLLILPQEWDKWRVDARIK